MSNMDMLRFKVLRAFGVAPWSEEAKELTDEMCLEYAELLDMETENGSGGFDEKAFLNAKYEENELRLAEPEETEKYIPKPDTSAMSDFIEREMRCRDTGFVFY